MVTFSWAISVGMRSRVFRVGMRVDVSMIVIVIVSMVVLVIVSVVVRFRGISLTTVIVTRATTISMTVRLTT